MSNITEASKENACINREAHISSVQTLPEVRIELGNQSCEAAAPLCHNQILYYDNIWTSHIHGPVVIILSTIDLLMYHAESNNTFTAGVTLTQLQELQREEIREEISLCLPSQ